MGSPSGSYEAEPSSVMLVTVTFVWSGPALAMGGELPARRVPISYLTRGTSIGTGVLMLPYSLGRMKLPTWKPSGSYEAEPSSVMLVTVTFVWSGPALAMGGDQTNVT